MRVCVRASNTERSFHGYDTMSEGVIPPLALNFAATTSQMRYAPLFSWAWEPRNGSLFRNSPRLVCPGTTRRSWTRGGCRHNLVDPPTST